MTQHSAPDSSIAAARSWRGALVALVAAVASLASLRNGFAFDDVAIIATNERIHQLSHWWRLFGMSYWPPSLGESLYRPLTSLAFAVQWSIGHGAPVIFHGTSIVLYVAVCVVVWRLLRRLVSDDAAWVAALLFAVHPVHVEAVGNVVGQAELWAALAVVLACHSYVARRQAGDPIRGRDTLGIGLLYVGGALFKEHALLLPALLMGLDAFAVRDARSWTQRARALAPLYLTLLFLGLAVLATRTWVLGSIVGEKQVVEMDLGTRIWMMFRVVPEWLRLFVFPLHLSAYYGPRDIEIVRGPSLWSMAGVLVTVLAATAFLMARRRQPIAAFALVWLGITLLPASNLVSGFILEEHTLFLPSVGAMLLVGVLWEWWERRRESHHALRGVTDPARLAVAALTAAVVVAWTIRSAQRHPVWKDNQTLFAATVVDAPLSYRAHYLYGTMLFETGRAVDGERELRTAIALSVNDSDPYNYLATKYREAKLYTQAIPLYRQAIALNSRRPDARFGLAYSLLETGDLAGARAEATVGLSGGQLTSYFRFILARADTLSSRAAQSEPLKRE